MLALMRGLTHRWMDPACFDPVVAASLASHVGVEPLVARALLARGMASEADARAFLDPRLTDLHDPSLLPGVDRAAASLLEALRCGAPVAIYGDYDVDGVCAAAILWHVCRALVPGADLRAYIPHRLDEGYGLNAEAIRALHADGVRLVVTVDCGVTAFAEANLARSLGLPLIITDHHTFARENGAPDAPPSLPDAHCIVHPQLALNGGPAYPFGDLCGAAVAFKLAWRLATLATGSERVGGELQTLLLDMLAFAALGTVADVVPLVGENRVIARFGLARLRSVCNPGLRALIDASGLAGEKVDSEHVGFVLAPRLNAAGRMGHARDAFELLTTARGERAAEIARSLTRLNDERRAIERSIFSAADALAEESGMTGGARRAIVLAHDDWHAGVLGIVCSRLVERRRRPSILLRRENGACHGSGRSVDGFDLHAALERCGDLLDKFGGHEMAAGLRVRTERLGAFVERFTEIANDLTTEETLTPALRPDFDAAPADLTARGVSQLARLGPFGRGNAAPLVRLRALRLLGAPSHLGKNGAHLAFSAAETKTGAAMRFVAWNWGDRRADIPSGATIDALVEPKVSTFGARPSVEPVVRDVWVHAPD